MTILDVNGIHWIPTLEYIENLILKVQEKGEHTEESSTTYDTSITEEGIALENDTFFTDGDPTNTLLTFKELLRCMDMEDIAEAYSNMISALELGKRDNGTTTSERKVKSLKQRWFITGKRKIEKSQILMRKITFILRETHW